MVPEEGNETKPRESGAGTAGHHKLNARTKALEGRGKCYRSEKIQELINKCHRHTLVKPTKENNGESLILNQVADVSKNYC